MKIGCFPRLDARILGATAVFFFAWSSVYCSLMFQIAPFETDRWDLLDICLRSLAGPAVFFALLLAIRRRSIRLVIGAVLSLVSFGVFAVYGLYYLWSGSVPHVALVVHMGEGADIFPQIVHQVATGRSVIVVMMWLVQLAALGFLPSGRLWSWRAAAITVFSVVSVAVVHNSVARIVWDAGDRVEARRLWVFDLNESVARFGLMQSWWRDAGALIERRRFPIDQDWPGTLSGRPAVPGNAPSARIRNVILLQVESLDPWVIEHEVRGNVVTPHLRAFARRARIFPNFFAQHSGGGSSDAELAIHLGVLPLATHSGLLSADWAAARPLPALLAGKGWSTALFHANRPSYFNRNLVFSRLGFDRFFSESDFSGPASGWESVDAEFMKQALDFVDSIEEPFFASLITLQSHGPFRHHRLKSDIEPGPEVSRLERDYLQCIHEVDQAIGSLLRWLDTEDRRNDTAVLLFGDHRSRARGPEPAGPERIPLMVIAPSLDAGSDFRVGTHLDLGPTVLDLLGLDCPDGWLGTTLLGPGPGAAVFNSLEEVTLSNGTVVVAKSPERMPFLLYSASVLGQ